MFPSFSFINVFTLQLVDENQMCADKNNDILDDLLILSCEDDYAICGQFLKSGIESFYLLEIMQL